MKNNTTITHFVVIITLMFSSACSPMNNEYVEEKAKEEREFKVEKLSGPIRLQHIRKSGMDYIIIHTEAVNPDIKVVNLTLDSLQVEIHKRTLSK